MNYLIRELKQDENKVLDTFLYEAIFIPEGVSAPLQDIINQPDLQVYVKDFGKNKGDLCLVAQVRDKIVGAVWVRIMNDYGHIDNETPSFAISLLKEYRNYGIGTELMKQMLTKLKLEGYKQASLSVQKMNYAVRMYRKIGFEIIDENLIETTNGIIQGMSGSPILQDGRIIGAVTHVFVNDPAKGYGIFIENMLDEN